MSTALAAAACILSVLALIAGLLALRTLGRLRRRITILSRGADQPESLLEASSRHAEAAMELGRRHQEIVDAVAAERAELREQLQTSTASNAAIVLTARSEMRTAVESLRAHVDGSSAAVRGEFASALNHMGEQTSRGLRRVALVRYDAFDDMAGRMSFSLALLDEHGEGVTISAIAGRTDTRVYAKGVTASAHGRRGRLIGAATPGAGDLTPEELQAVDAALAPTKAAPYPDGVPAGNVGDDALSAAAS